MTALVLAIPSKGRLHEQAIALLSAHQLNVRNASGARDYQASFAELDSIRVSLLSAADIADQLSAGKIHLGITGEDLLKDHPTSASRTKILKRLGFGRAEVVVAVPKSWLDVSTMADLDDVAASFHLRHGRKLKVATKYMNLARNFFAGHGIADYLLVESLGATEGTPAAGTAEVIVDITTTGATLESNGLKTLTDGTILKSEAVLAESVTAHWDDQARAAKAQLLAKFG